MPLDGVREVLPLLPVTSLPGVPPFLLGLVNVRGTPLAVLDLHHLFRGSTLVPGERARILVLEADGVQAGIMTQGVTRIARFEPRQMERPETPLGNIPLEALEGLVADPERPVVLLRPRAILALDAIRSLRSEGL